MSTYKTNKYGYGVLNTIARSKAEQNTAQGGDGAVKTVPKHKADVGLPWSRMSIDEQQSRRKEMRNNTRINQQFVPA